MLEWSPISGWLKIRYADDESMRVSHETIYRSLFIQARGVLKKAADRALTLRAQTAALTQGRKESGAAWSHTGCSVDPRASRGG